jgi:hypothetical protein
MTLDDAVDRLYSVELADFTEERNRLAKELRDEGRRDEAAEVAKLRKPTVAAWAVNQLARRHRRDVDLLLDAGHRLRQAQAGVLRGSDKEEFERARATEREVVQRLTNEAAELLGGSTSSATLAQIAETLRAAVVSEAGREQLARGQLAAALEPEGFGVLGGLAPATPPERTRKPAARADERRAARDAQRAARERLRELEREARAAEREAEKLERQWLEAKKKAEDARAAADEASGEPSRD